MALDPITAIAEAAGGLFNMTGSIAEASATKAVARSAGTVSCGAKPDCKSFLNKDCKKRKDEYNTCVATSNQQNYEVAMAQINATDRATSSKVDSAKWIKIGVIAGVVILVLALIMRR